MLEQKRMGLLIKKLREKQNLTQQQLADMIPISREAISKWERGRTCPDYEVMLKLSKIFDVTIDELLYGEVKTKNNIDKIDSITLKLWQDRNKKQKLLYISWGIFGLVVGFFLIYYFFSYFRAINIYTINLQNANLKITNGMVVTTPEKVYFSLGNISTNKEIKMLELYYIDKDNSERLLTTTSNKNVFFSDSLGYNEYFEFKILDYIWKNIYLKVTYDDYKEIIKLELNNVYVNDNLGIKTFEF